jgi:hypothetical protein
MEESGSWRHPIDLVNILENGFKELSRAVDDGKKGRVRVQTQHSNHPKDRNALVEVLLGDNPLLIVNALVDELKQGTTGEELATGYWNMNRELSNYHSITCF